MKKSFIYKAFCLSTIVPTLLMATDQSETPKKTVVKNIIQRLDGEGTYDGLTPNSKKEMQAFDFQIEYKKVAKKEESKKLEEKNKFLELEQQKRISELKVEGQKIAQEYQKKIADLAIVKERENDRIQQLNVEIESIKSDHKQATAQLEKEQKDFEEKLRQSSNISKQERETFTKTLESKQKFISLLKSRLDVTSADRDELEKNLDKTSFELKVTQNTLEIKNEELLQTTGNFKTLETALNSLILSPSAPLPPIIEPSPVLVTTSNSSALPSQPAVRVRRGINPESR